MADYSARFSDFRAAGIELAAISVDDAARSAPMRKDLEIEFPLLGDPRRETVEAYGLLNRGEHGGIAFPAVFLIDKDRVVRFRALEEMASRIAVDQLLELARALNKGAAPTNPRTRGVWPGTMFLRATVNAMLRGVRVPEK